MSHRLAATACIARPRRSNSAAVKGMHHTQQGLVVSRAYNQEFLLYVRTFNGHVMHLPVVPGLLTLEVALQRLAGYVDVNQDTHTASK